MSQQPGEFIFIMLKPAAANDVELSSFIKKRLAKYGDIKYIRNSIIVNKEKISKHYKYSKSSFWYPLLVNYFSNKTVQCFILEYNPDKPYPDFDSEHSSFAKFLKTEVIGPSDICKLKKHHLRRLAMRKVTFLLDNLIHSSDNNQEALEEIRIWYEDEPMVIAEFERKALA